jgi:serine/threonine protein kinase/tetratricopeptide (TPR) repeat protein
MPLDTVAALVDALRQYRILEPHHLAELQRDLQGKFTDPRALAKELIQRGWLTPFQINRLFQGKGQELILSSYVLIDPLGQGGMGQVYKARHQRLDRIDAVKVIRNNLLSNANAIERFRREAKAAARLSHPNVVTVYDAGEVGTTQFLAMEFIPGTDLSKLVKEKGPLPVTQACEFIRQAASGLAHAHEKGLVHRDIKPSNLLICEAQGSQSLGLIKILDLGLARLGPLTPDQTADSLTDTGAVVGTADFIAPEQARNARDVDIRADIYSLGCTLYFLLSGKIPFPGETLTEKLIKHQLDEPRPLESLRTNVPPPVLAVVRKMMAKKAEDRYQTPTDVVRALQPFSGVMERASDLLPVPVAQQVMAAPSPGITSAPPPPPMAMPAFSDLSLGPGVSSDTVPLRERQRSRPPRSVAVMLLVPVVAFLVVGVVGAAVWWAVGRKPDAVAATNSPATKPTTTAANVATDPKEAGRHFDLGTQLYGKAQYQQAIAEFTRAIELDPKIPEAYANRGLAFKMAGAADKALSDYDRAIDLYLSRPRDPREDPKVSKVYFNRATVFHDRGEWDRCIADNTRVIELNPKDPVAYNNRGTIYKIRRQYDMAIADFDTALRLNSTYLSPLTNRAGTYIQKGDFDLAIVDYEAAIRRDPDNSIGYQGRGQARMLKGQLKEALEDFNQAIKINPKDALAYLHRSVTYQKMGNQPQANADYQQAVKLDPRLAKPGG